MAKISNATTRDARLSKLECLLLTAPHPLLFRILSFWHLSDILASDRVSCVLHNVVRYYKSIVWNPDIFFERWFRDSPTEFRRTLGECGAAVSGSQITQFLDRTIYDESDMDIFLRIGGVQHMGGWLESQGYTYSESDTSDYEAFSRDLLRLSSRIILERNPTATSIKGVFDYARYIASTTVIFIQKIQLIVVDTNPIHHIIFDFHSTAVINYMVADAVVSVFPRSTLLLHKSYVVRSRQETIARTMQWKNKYRERGYQIIRKRTGGAHPDLPPDPTSTLTIYGNAVQDVNFEVLGWRSGRNQEFGGNERQLHTATKNAK
ncbi:hypothetical protein B0H16DRAFT_1803411 [Mycena metata]|uniref:F-box domain-containing protein n=1 Tax=Mycena metata TaxID=1033252 RepID=A0AAD7P0M3_9AGAR|nr:hypothetical protein B0H16DRAFT_1803411 [Mycena metata]